MYRLRLHRTAYTTITVLALLVLASGTLAAFFGVNDEACHCACACASACTHAAALAACSVIEQDLQPCGTLSLVPCTALSNPIDTLFRPPQS